MEKRAPVTWRENGVGNHSILPEEWTSLNSIGYRQSAGWNKVHGIPVNSSVGMATCHRFDQERSALQQDGTCTNDEINTILGWLAKQNIIDN